MTCTSEFAHLRFSQDGSVCSESHLVRIYASVRFISLQFNTAGISNSASTETIADIVYCLPLNPRLMERGLA